MRRTLAFCMPTLLLSFIIQVLGSFLLWVFYLPIAGQVHAAAPINPSGLNTQVSDPIVTGSGPTQTIQYDITGGTRPGGATGTNLFHSFGDFNVPNNNIANFLNDSGLATSNILGRVSGGTPSTIFGTIQTTGFGNANLFLMNPYGFLFGPNATVNVGGMMTFTTADYMRLRGLDSSNAGIFHADTAQPSILTSAPVAAFGFIGSNPHSIDFIGGQLNVASGTGLALVGGDINLTPDSSVVPNVPSSITAPGRSIQMTSVAGPGEVAADTGIPAVGMALGTVMLGQGTTLDTSYNSGAAVIDSGNGGAISIRGGQFIATSATIFTNPAFGSAGQGGAVTIVATAPASFNDSVIDTHSDVANGGGGAVSISASDLTLQNTTLMTNVFGDGITPVIGGSGAVTLAATNGLLSIADSAIDTSTFFAGSGGTVNLTGTESVILTRSNIHTDSFFPFSNGNGGAVSVMAPIVSVEESFIFTSANGDGFTPTTANSGEVTLTGTTNVSLLRSSISTDSFETQGNSGAITIMAPTVTIIGGPSGSSNSAITANVVNTSRDPNAGNGGDIVITATQTNVTIADFALLQSAADSAGTSSRGGDIRINGAQNILLDNGTSFVTSTTSNGNAGNIELVSPHVTIRGQSSLASDAFDPGSGNAGTIKITATENIALESGSTLFTTANPASLGSAGHIEFNTPQLTIVGGSRARSETFGPGLGGTVTIQGISGPAQSVLISDPNSGIFTNAHDTGAGGNIFVNANSVSLQNGGTLSAATSGTEATATGGYITVIATNQITMTGNALISSSSTGAGNAGHIHINAGRQLDMRDSSINTEAAHASGGNIDIEAVDRVRLVNSTISTSVHGESGSGGNISIDPNVVVLQNSQVIAQAVQGAGGNITITTPLFLADQTSLVSASSEFGLNGTVTIQNPTSNLSESLGPLPSSMLEQQALQAQRCAALHGGASSSFIIGGRDTVPTEPGGWLASSLGLHSIGHNLLADTMIDDQLPINLVMAQTSEAISLRRLTPIGFLTQRFAGNGSDGCRS